MQFFRIVMAVLDSCLPFLYAIAEKGRKDEERTDQEQARAHKRYDGLGNAVLARVHLDVDLECGNDGENRSDGIADIQDVQHHRDHEVVHRGQRVCAPTVVHAAALGQRRTGNKA